MNNLTISMIRNCLLLEYCTWLFETFQLMNVHEFIFKATEYMFFVFEYHSDYWYREWVFCLSCRWFVNNVNTMSAEGIWGEHGWGNGTQEQQPGTVSLYFEIIYPQMMNGMKKHLIWCNIFYFYLKRLHVLIDYH